ncbi:hypothetical protein ACJIZ3_005892 [Penstemon smallii]|uniref:Uncharacterized protein n=1 Tax=Penstemon smallii TaxID=265156 RepID=A0ABD3S698_9LAMI
MPPEQLPWDRRDFRKHERSDLDPRLGNGGFVGGGPNRWREQPHAPPYHQRHQQQQQQQRWYSDFRSTRPIPPGHGKQGGWHMYSGGTGNGFVPFGSNGNGRYIRNNRENRPSFSKKEWKASSWETVASPSGPGRPTPEVSNQRFVENIQSGHNKSSKIIDFSSHSPDSANLADQSQSLLKEQHDKNGGTADRPTSTDQKFEKENELGLIDNKKPLKWPRSGSLSSRGAGFRHSSSKSLEVESIETVAEVHPENVTPVQPPSADAPTCVPTDETCSKKKPRLGWGQGLAKYEKKKVEGPEDSEIKNGLDVSVSDTKNVQTHAVNLLDNSPRVASSLVRASPATPSSVACSSSPGIEKKQSIMEANTDQCTTNLRCSPNIVSQAQYDGPIFNLENLEITSVFNLSTLIDKLLQSDDPSSVETGYVQTSSMNKLLMWKVDMLKALEMTESEIDSLETELKLLTAEARMCCRHPASSSSLPEDCPFKPCEDQVTDSTLAVRPAPLQVVSTGDMIVEYSPVSLENKHVVLKDDDIDSPGSATSKFVGQPAKEDIFPSETAGCIEDIVNLNVNNSRNLDEKYSKNDLRDEENAGHGDNHEVSLTSSSQDLASASNMHCDLDDVYDSILASNKASADRALKQLNKLLPSKQRHFDIPSAQRDSSVVKEKFLMRKRFLQFKEKVTVLRFKVFQHFWKEGRVVSVRKLRLKSHKKFDLSGGHKKNRASCRSRISSSFGSSQTVPADEVIEFVNWLLSESSFRPYTGALKMPALILDKKEMKMSTFISNNGLVEDCFAVEKERSMINPWTSEEREVFIDKLATFGKDFKKIASFLEHKTIADCIEFYYKNHKSECFQKAWKKPDFMKQKKSQSTTYLVGSGKRWNRESNAASLDILGAASAIAANVDAGIEIPQNCTSRFFFGASSSYKASKGNDDPLQSPDMDSNERETAAADVLAGICASISSEAMSSSITSSLDHRDGHLDWRCHRVVSSRKRPLTPEVTHNIDDECSDESCREMDTSDWTDEEKSIFIQALSTYGKDYVMISQSVRTRSRDQCKLFFNKACKRLRLDRIKPGAGNDVSGDVNGGGSDIEGACAVGTSSVICNGPGCQMEDDISHPDVKLNQEKNDVVEAQNLRPGFEICGENNGPCTLDMDAEPVLKQFPDINMNNKERNGVSVSAQELGTLYVSSNSETVRVEEEDDVYDQPKGPSLAKNRALFSSSDGNYGEDNEGQGLLSPEDDLDDEVVEDRDAINSSEVSAPICAVNPLKADPQIVSHPCSSIQVDKVSGCQSKADLESCAAEKSLAMPLQQNGQLASLKSSTLLSVPIKYQKNPSHNALSADIETNRISDEHSQKIVPTCDSQQRFLSRSLSDPVESPQTLRGFPVSLQTMKEINGDFNCNRSLPHQNVPKQDGILHSDRHKEFPVQKCSNSSRHQSEVVNPLFPSQEQSRDHPKPLSGCSSNLKLFGKILISSDQTPNSCAQQADDDNNKADSRQSLNLKFSGDKKVNLDSAQTKFDCNKNICSEDNVRSYGFWDGHRIQIGGSPPLPDSTLLLNKYPDAFSNYAMPTLERELPPFGIDMKQPQVVLLLSEMQRRNGLDVVGTGGQCLGVSDPVAAIKMHAIKEDDVNNNNTTRSSNGNVGR